MTVSVWTDTFCVKRVIVTSYEVASHSSSFIGFVALCFERFVTLKTYG